MTLAYLARFFCLCFAAYFLAGVSLAAAVSAAASRLLERAERMPARSAARLLAAARLFPAAAAALLVALFCAPSYLWLEPHSPAERVSPFCVAAGVLGAAWCVAGAVRGVRAAARSSRYVRRCRSAAETAAPVLLLAGILRPRLVVSRGIRQALSPEQLDAALRHERAHRVFHDNLKRLLMALTPTPIPGWDGLDRLERGWRRMAEWAADDLAVAGSPERAVALATALLCVARMGRALRGAPLATALLDDAGGLAERVERLLATPAPDLPARRRSPLMAVAALAGLLAVPAVLPVVHGALEALAH